MTMTLEPSGAATPKYALRTAQERRYLVRDPATGDLVHEDALADWGPPVTLPLSEAQAVAASLNSALPPEAQWLPEGAPGPCPMCGQEVFADDHDFAYPENREYTRWRAGCNHHDFGCGYEVLGSSWEEVMDKWSRGAPHEGHSGALQQRVYAILFAFKGPHIASEALAVVQSQVVDASVHAGGPSGATWALKVLLSHYSPGGAIRAVERVLPSGTAYERVIELEPWAYGRIPRVRRA